MTAKEYLKHLSRMEALIESKKERARTLRELAESTGSSQITGMPHSPSKSPSMMEDSICKAVDLENEIRNDEKRLLQKKVWFLELIGRLEEPMHQIVLTKHYFDHKTWQEISEETFYSIRWVYSTHGQALKVFIVNSRRASEKPGINWIVINFIMFHI